MSASNIVIYHKHPRIFLSHAHSDLKRPIVKQLIEDLKQLTDVWIDTQNIPIGKSWSREIEDGITGATYFVLLASKKSVRREVVLDEIDFALRQKKNIIPLRLDDDVKFPFGLTRLQYLSFLTVDDYSSNFPRLLQAIGVDEASYTPRVSSPATSTSPTIFHRMLQALDLDATLPFSIPRTSLFSTQTNLSVHPESAGFRIQQSIKEIRELNEKIQADLWELSGSGKTAAAPYNAWQNEVPSSVEAEQLADLAAREDLDPQISRNAATLVAGSHSRKAIERLIMKAASNGEDGAWRALAHIRTETPLPSQVVGAVRNRTFRDAIWIELTDDRPELFLWRYICGFVGSGLSIGGTIYITYRDILGNLAIMRVNTAWALGMTFGVLMGFAILMATEIPARLRLLPTMWRFIVGTLLGGLFCVVAFMPITMLYYQYELFTFPLIVLPFIAVSGFALASALSRNILIRMIIGSSGLFLAIFGGWWRDAHKALFGFEATANVLMISLAISLIIGGLAYLPEFIGVVRHFVPFRPNDFGGRRYDA